MATIKEMLTANTADILEATELLKVLGDREGQFVWKQLTAEGGEFVAFVTADDENSYPNGGTQDGYWYELVGEDNAFGANVWNKYASYTPARSGTISFKAYSYNENNGSVQIQVVPSGGITLADITINDLVGKRILSRLDSSGSTNARVDVLNTTQLSYVGTGVTFNYSYNASNGIISFSTSGWYAKCFGTNTTYQSFTKTVPSAIGEQLGYVVSDDSAEYPNGGTDRNGFYYTLLGHVDSANIMRLSNDAYGAVETEVVNGIANEVSEVGY